jgi:glutaredoxin
MQHGHKESEEYLKDNKCMYKRQGIETYVEQDYVTYIFNGVHITRFSLSVCVYCAGTQLSIATYV